MCGEGDTGKVCVENRQIRGHYVEEIVDDLYNKNRQEGKKLL